jgi:hypothetical protein
LRGKGGEVADKRLGTVAPGSIGIEGIVSLGNRAEKVDASEEHIHMFRADDKLSFSCQHETVFEDMCYLHGGLKTDDTGRAFERMRSPHHGLNRLRRALCLFNGQDAR